MNTAEQHGHGHGHGHEGVEDIDWEKMADTLVREAELNTANVEQTLSWLRDVLGARATDVSRVLDVGSGPGVSTALLAHAFPSADVVAVDGSAPLLERALQRARDQRLGDRVHTLEAELPENFPMLGKADLVWISHALHHLGDQQAALSELAGTLRPGGLLAVTERGLPLRFLPRDIGIGRPGLLARLEVRLEDRFADMRASLPGSTAVPEHWPGLLEKAGLTPSGSRTFLTEAPTPLAHSAREYLQQHLSKHRELLVEESDAEDLATIDQLLDTTSDAGILRRPDAFYLTATTVHTAIR